MLFLAGSSTKVYKQKDLGTHSKKFQGKKR